MVLKLTAAPQSASELISEQQPTLVQKWPTAQNAIREFSW
jgi:hypothetical protein